MSSYLKRWRPRTPRAGGAASEEWEELSEVSDREDAEDADAVVVGAAAATPAAKDAPKDSEQPAELEQEDPLPFALLRIRIRPASAAFWGQWTATCVLLLTSAMMGGIVARVDGAPAVRLSSSAVAGDNASRVLRGEYKGVAYECAPVAVEVAAVAAPAPPPPPEPEPEAPPPPAVPTFFAPLRAADVADGARQLAAWLRRHGRGALADASHQAGPLARSAAAAARRGADAALGALDAAGRSVATGGAVPAPRAHHSTPLIVTIVDQLRAGLRESLAVRVPRRMPFEALREHAASRLF